MLVTDSAQQCQLEWNGVRRVGCDADTRRGLLQSSCSRQLTLQTHISLAAQGVDDRSTERLCPVYVLHSVKEHVGGAREM